MAVLLAVCGLWLCVACVPSVAGISSGVVACVPSGSKVVGGAVGA